MQITELSIRKRQLKKKNQYKIKLIRQSIKPRTPIQRPQEKDPKNRTPPPPKVHNQVITGTIYIIFFTLNNMYMKAPSFYAHAFNGILLLTAFIIIIINIKYLKQLDIYKQIMLLLIFTLVVGVHGLSHLGLEQAYQYNPLSMLP